MKSIKRRAAGVLIGVFPFALSIIALISQREPISGIIALALSIAALVVASFNLWITLIRPAIWKARNDTMEGFSPSSVLPMLGTLLVIVACVLGFGDNIVATCCLVAICLDIGGVPWLIWSTWNDESFWDEPVIETVEQAVPPKSDRAGG